MSQTEVQLIKDAVIVNADISNSAAIDVSKISGALPAAGGTITGDVTFDGETAGRDIVFDRSDNALEFADNAKATFGNDADLKIYHNGSASIIEDPGAGTLKIRTYQIDFEDGNGSATHAKFNGGGSVELNHNNSKKFETTSTGAIVTGSVSNTGTGTTSYLRNVTLESYSEKLVDAGTVGSTYTYTLADGNYFKVGLGQTCTFTFDASNAPSQVYSFVIQLKNGTGGPFSITWPASVEWPAGVTPTRTTTDGRTDIWSFITTDGGTNWLGNLNIVNYNV